MDKYNMKIANRGGLNKNGCYTFSELNINNLPDINAFKNEAINKLIIDGCKQVLRESMSIKNKYRYGEIGLLLSFGHIISKKDDRPKICKLYHGTYHHITTNPEYYNIVNTRGTKDLIFIHNHPNGSSFSGADILELTGVNNLNSVVAVGNRHNLFVLIDVKKDKSAYNEINEYIKNQKEHNSVLDETELRNKAAHVILNNPDNYGLMYFKYRRKNI